MKNRKVISVLVLIAMIISVLVVNAPIVVMAANTTYYVDSATLDDAMDGKSPTTAWKTLSKVNGVTFGPGDRILFKAGGSWTGMLSPKGSGDSTASIIIDMYGTGNKPIINGIVGDNTKAVYLYNQSYWEINNLDVTMGNGAYSTNMRAVWIQAQDIGQVNHIYLKNLYVHDVMSNNTNKTTGGIFFYVPKATTPAWFNDIKILNCYIKHVDACAITTWSDINDNVAGTWKPFTNVLIEGNTVEDIGRDGIVPQVCQSPLIQYNTSIKANQRSGAPGAAIWPYNCNDSIFQYNEASQTYATNTANDGQGFDCDYQCNRTIFQYNYSHNNTGGFMLICSDGSWGFQDGAIVRYNISQNDTTRIINILGNPKNTLIYNNVFYTGTGLSVIPVNIGSWNGTATNVTFKNNIFYAAGTAAAWGLRSGTGVVFDYNTMYGTHGSKEPADSHKLTTNPMFVNPGTGGNGTTTVDGYKLQASSPCINSGISISNNGLKDYWGKILYNGNPDRGAGEY